MAIKHIIGATFLLALAASASAAVPLKIYKDDQPGDTVYKSTYYFVGITDPKAKASVVGNDCHVYRTGSFGAEIKLAEGDNYIPVRVSLGEESADSTVRIVYVSRPKSAPSKPDATVPLQWPLHLVTKSGAYLQYGNGSDRLGGSKMGFLDPDVELTAIGETSGLYKVMLGDNGYAFVPKEYVERGGEGARAANSGSAVITNTGNSDRFSISLPYRMPYWSRAEIDPSTITISLYGAMNNTNWFTRRGELGMVDFVDLRQQPGGVLDIVIRLKDKYQWGYSVGYEGDRLVVNVKHRPASLALKDLVIGLDAGHGGAYPGACSPSGLTEKEVNLDIVLNVAEMLRAKGARLVLTRDGDTDPSMAERKKIWREGGVDLAVSVHNNSSGNPLKPMGTSSYYKHISNMPLASALHSSMLELGLTDFGLTGNFNFSLNAPTEYPNALVEVLFMSSLPEEELLADPAYRRKLAVQIVRGIENYLAEVKKSLAK